MNTEDVSSVVSDDTTGMEVGSSQPGSDPGTPLGGFLVGGARFGFLRVGHVSAPCRCTNPTYHPLVHGFLAGSGRARKFPMLISTHTTPTNSRLVYFTRAAPEWPLGETATEKHTESTRVFISGAKFSSSEPAERPEGPQA